MSYDNPQNHHAIMTFRPTFDEFKDFAKYIEFIESQGAAEAGIAKIVPPPEWVPRKSGYSLESLKGTVVHPEMQTVTAHNTAGTFIQVQNRKTRMYLSEFVRCSAGKNDAPANTDDDALEQLYWKNVTTSALYGCDQHATLMDADLDVWNFNKLDSILKFVPVDYKIDVKGVTTPFLYFGRWNTSFAWHTEDLNLYSISYNHYGAPKTWYSVPRVQGRQLEDFVAHIYRMDCDAYLRHKTALINPQMLRNRGMQCNKIVQRKGEIIVTFPYGYHAGFNHGYNIAEAVNFATERWIDFGKYASRCRCQIETFGFTMHKFVERFQPERYENWLKGEDFGKHPVYQEEGYVPWPLILPKKKEVTPKRKAKKAKKPKKANAIASVNTRKRRGPAKKPTEAVRRSPRRSQDNKISTSEEHIQTVQPITSPEELAEEIKPNDSSDQESVRTANIYIALEQVHQLINIQINPIVMLSPIPTQNGSEMSADSGYQQNCSAKTSPDEDSANAVNPCDQLGPNEVLLNPIAEKQPHRNIGLATISSTLKSQSDLNVVAHGITERNHDLNSGLSFSDDSEYGNIASVVVISDDSSEAPAIDSALANISFEDTADLDSDLPLDLSTSPPASKQMSEFEPLASDSTSTIVKAQTDASLTKLAPKPTSSETFDLDSEISISVDADLPNTTTVSTTGGLASASTRPDAYQPKIKRTLINKSQLRMRESPEPTSSGSFDLYSDISNSLDADLPNTTTVSTTLGLASATTHPDAYQPKMTKRVSPKPTSSEMFDLDSEISNSVDADLPHTTNVPTPGGLASATTHPDAYQPKIKRTLINKSQLRMRESPEPPASETFDLGSDSSISIDDGLPNTTTIPTTGGLASATTHPDAYQPKIKRTLINKSQLRMRESPEPPASETFDLGSDSSISIDDDLPNTTTVPTTVDLANATTPTTAYLNNINRNIKIRNQSQLNMRELPNPERRSHRYAHQSVVFPADMPTSTPIQQMGGQANRNWPKMKESKINRKERRLERVVAELSSHPPNGFGRHKKYYKRLGFARSKLAQYRAIRALNAAAESERRKRQWPCDQNGNTPKRARQADSTQPTPSTSAAAASDVVWEPIVIEISPKDICRQPCFEQTLIDFVVDYIRSHPAAMRLEFSRSGCHLEVHLASRRAEFSPEFQERSVARLRDWWPNTRLRLVKLTENGGRPTIQLWLVTPKEFIETTKLFLKLTYMSGEAEIQHHSW